MNFINFFRLLIYHIYIYYMKVDDHNKPLAKFTTMLIFTLIGGFLVVSTYDLIFQFREAAYTNMEDKYYRMLFVIIASFISIYLYKEGFTDLDKSTHYHRKYYIYFILLVLITAALTIWSGSVSRERIFENEKYGKSIPKS